jgi:nucleoside-diphosphate-sugar epimerase
LAHLTRDREAEWEPYAFAEENERLTSAALKLAQLPTVRAVVLASSGASVTSPESLYGRGKAVAESLFLDHSRRTGQPCVVARAWSLSGSLCPKPQIFALYDLISQAKRHGSISISSAASVWRRYVDAGEFLETCLSAAGADVTSVIDSYGELVEIGELAERVLSTLMIKGEVARVDPSGTPNYYAAYSSAFDEWAGEFSVRVSDLEEQIRRSSAALQWS